MERRSDGVLLNVPAGASYMDFGEEQADVRDGAVTVVGSCLDPHAGVGVVGRLKRLGTGSTGYALVVRPGVGAGAYTLFQFYVSRTETQYQPLRDWEVVPGVRPVGAPNAVQLRAVGSWLQAYVNGTRVACVEDTRCALGTWGWVARSYGGTARVLLHALEARTAG
jgi:hypothetical protein